jgi:hypothetical protein
MSITKKQHYVPRLYLRQFADPPGSDKVWVYDKGTGKRFQTNVERIAHENYFMDPSGNLEQPFEKMFGVFESLFDPVLKIIINQQDITGLTVDEKISVVAFVVAQEYRTRTYRDQMKSFYSDFRDTLPPVVYAAFIGDAPGDDEELARALQQAMFSNHVFKPSMNKLLRMHWMLGVNQTSIPLWTSDHPVTRRNQYEFDDEVTRMLMPRTGLWTPGVEVHLPLTPSLVLTLGDERNWSDLPPSGELVSVQDVYSVNALQLSQSGRFLYSNSDDFSWATAEIEKFPSLRESSGKFRIFGGGPPQDLDDEHSSADYYR